MGKEEEERNNTESFKSIIFEEEIGLATQD
jgi:hypothetical protein